MEGIASRVRRDQEGSTTVLRFIVTAEDGTRAAVEMRGEKIRGLLDEGDRVVLVLESYGRPAGGVHSPLSVENRTTGSVVTAWRASLPKRATKPLLTTLGTAVISSAVTFCFGLVTGGGSDPGRPVTGGGNGAVDGESTDWFPFAFPGAILGILAISALLWVVWFGIFSRRRRRLGRPIWSVAPGLVLGVTIGVWAFAVSDRSTFG